MNIYVANFGFENVHWPVCQSDGVLTLYTSKKLFQCWTNGDRDEWIEWATRNARMTNGQLAIKPVASRWFNLLTIFHETLDDIWIHRDGDRLFWTRTVSGPTSVSHITDPTTVSSKTGRVDHSNPYLLLKRPTQRWRSTTEAGRPLLWQGLHPKSRDFLQTEATYQEVANDRGYRDYVLSLLNDQNLDAWHNRIEWKEKPGQKNLVRTFSALETTIFDAMLRIRSTVAKADGRIVERVSKIKNLTVSEEEFRHFLRRLYDEQGGLCMLTGLRMLLNGEDGADDFRLSVDRIDSNGHYDPSNVQLVCRFANFWKSSGDDSRFKELIQIVRETPLQ